MSDTRSIVHSVISSALESKIREWTQERDRNVKFLEEWKGRESEAEAKIAEIDGMLLEAKTQLASIKNARAGEAI